MARPQELIPGNCYFLLHFCDPDLLFPDITTLRFIEEGSSADGEPLWIFEDAAAAAAAGDEDQTGDPEPQEVTAIGIAARELANVLDFAGLLAHLSSVGQDHPLRRPRGPARDTLPPCSDFGELDARIAEFMSEPRYAWVTIVAEYTEDGFTLARSPTGEFEIAFTVNPRVEPDVEAQIRRVAQDAGLSPLEDSLADRGRVRALAYAMPADQDFVQRLAAQVFTQVFDLREGDGWRFTFHVVEE